MRKLYAVKFRIQRSKNHKYFRLGNTPNVLEVTISDTESSVKAGDNGVLSCVVEAHDVGTAIQWFKNDSAIALTSDDTAYTIVTTLATDFEDDSVTKKSTSTLTILDFDSANVASYFCRVIYSDPILSDQSPEQALKILGKFLVRFDGS